MEDEVDRLDRFLDEQRGIDREEDSTWRVVAEDGTVVCSGLSYDDAWDRARLEVGVFLRFEKEAPSA